MNRPAKITITNEVNCIVTGLLPDHIDYFYEAYGKYAPNYFFQKRFTLGKWDGKIRYFYKKGNTFVYLLDEIVPKLYAFGYKVNLVDQRTGGFVEIPQIDKTYISHIINLKTGKPYELRYYQVDSINASTQVGHGISIVGTGGGKTFTTAVLADLYSKAGLKPIVIVPNTSLILQTINDGFEELEMDVGEYSGDRKDINHKSVVSTWQALQHNPEIMRQFDVVIVDECHGLKGHVLTKLLNEYGSHIAYRFGCTGTLPKPEADAMAVRIAIGDVVHTKPSHELIEEGYLAKLHISVMQLDEPFKGPYEEWKLANLGVKMTYTRFKDSYFPTYKAEKSYLQLKKERLQWIADLVDTRRNMKKGNVIGLVTSIAFGKRLQKLIPNSKFVYGKDKAKIRKQVYDLFEEHSDLVVIATAQIAGVGISIDRIFNMFLIDIGQSFIRTIQAIGRGLRKGADKDHVDVIDVCSDLKYSKRHLRERKKYYKEAKYPFKVHKIDYAA